MGSVQQVARFHGQTRMRTVALTLGALAFALAFRFVVAKSMAPDPMGHAEWWMTFALIAVCLSGVLRAIWHAFAPRLEVTLTPYPPVVSEPVQVTWEFPSDKVRPRKLRIEARFLGVRRDRQGHNVDTPSRVPLVTAGDDVPSHGSLEVELPTDLVPTSPRRSNKDTYGKWSLEVRARIKGAPGVFESYPIRITRG